MIIQPDTAGSEALRIGQNTMDYTEPMEITMDYNDYNEETTYLS